MTRFDIDAIRTQIRAMDFELGTPAEVVAWREDDTNSRANLAIEGMTFEPDEEALFDMMLEEAVPPSLATQIILKLLDQPTTAQSS